MKRILRLGLLSLMCIGCEDWEFYGTLFPDLPPPSNPDSPNPNMPPPKFSWTENFGAYQENSTSAKVADWLFDEGNLLSAWEFTEKETQCMGIGPATSVKNIILVAKTASLPRSFAYAFLKKSAYSLPITGNLKIKYIATAMETVVVNVVLLNDDLQTIKPMMGTSADLTFKGVTDEAEAIVELPYGSINENIRAIQLLYQPTSLRYKLACVRIKSITLE